MKIFRAAVRAVVMNAALTRAHMTKYPLVVCVIALGIVVRAILLPLTHGRDFIVWDLASAATLHGSNVYAHHPHYPGGPYAYFPLFLYLELPAQWIAVHAHVRSHVGQACDRCGRHRRGDRYCRRSRAARSHRSNCRSRLRACTS